MFFLNLMIRLLPFFPECTFKVSVGFLEQILCRSCVLKSFDFVSLAVHSPVVRAGGSLRFTASSAASAASTSSPR